MSKLKVIVVAIIVFVIVGLIGHEDFVQEKLEDAVQKCQRYEVGSSAFHGCINLQMAE